MINNKESYIPTKAHIIFDQQQAYSAYSLPKIQFKQFDRMQEKLIAGGVQIIRKQLDQPETSKEEIETIKKSYSAYPILRQEPRLKDWNVNYLDDIAKRVASRQQLQSSNNKEYLDQIKKMQKPPLKKKTRRHKTKFKIQKTNNNQNTLQNVVCQFINSNKKSINDEVVRIKEYEKSAPFFLETVDFAERLIAEKQQFKEKYGLDEKNLRKNNLILEEVILKRIQRRENLRNKNKIVNEEVRRTKELEKLQKLKDSEVTESEQRQINKKIEENIKTDEVVQVKIIEV